MNASPLAAEPLPAAQHRTADERTLLVKVFGKDRPGITAGLFATLAGFGVDVIDIEQVVTRGRITLCALVTPPPYPPPRVGCGPPSTAGPTSRSSRPRSSPASVTTGRAVRAVRTSRCSAIR